MLTAATHGALLIFCLTAVWTFPLAVMSAWYEIHPGSDTKKTILSCGLVGLGVPFGMAFSLFCIIKGAENGVPIYVSIALIISILLSLTAGTK